MKEKVEVKVYKTRKRAVKAYDRLMARNLHLADKFKDYVELVWNQNVNRWILYRVRYQEE